MGICWNVLMYFNSYLMSFQKQRNPSSEEDPSKNLSVQDFIKKQQAYFKEIDAFELPEEEVGSAEELE